MDLRCEAIAPSITFKMGSELETMYELKLQAVCCQARARCHWNTLFLLDTATIIPRYGSYDFDWKMSGFCNPFDFDWFNYNCHELLMVRYLEVTFAALDEQVTIWASDGYTAETELFALVEKFVARLKALYVGTVEAAEKTVFCDEGDNVSGLTGLSD